MTDTAESHKRKARCGLDRIHSVGVHVFSCLLACLFVDPFRLSGLLLFSFTVMRVNKRVHIV